MPGQLVPDSASANYFTCVRYRFPESSTTPQGYEILK